MDRQAKLPYRWGMDDGNAQIEIAATVDAVGLLCPLPVLRARKRLQALAPGAVLRLLASDPAAVIDVPHFCTQSGHEFLGCTDDDGHQAYLIRKTA